MPNSQIEKHTKYKALEEAKIEQQFLKGIKDKEIGVFCDIFSAKSGIEGQNGGVVSALLVKGFEEGLFDSAIVVRRGIGYSAEAIIATNSIEVLAAKGSKYVRVNVTKKLRELISQGKKRIAIVCTPCEAKAARKIQQTLKKDCEIMIIGLFCLEAFNAAKLKKEIENKFNLAIDKAQKIQVKQGKFTAVVDEKEYNCKVKELDSATEKACHYCDDFTAQFADISVGSVGSKKGYSTVIVRSKAGERLLKRLELEKETLDTGKITIISNFKRKRAQKNLAALKNRQ
jgi:coenzyme F420-reducing hydrogenase beta subunit